jgi:hypothetical protein
MQRFVLALSFAVILALNWGTARAQDSAHRRLAEELLILTEVETRTQAMFEAMKKMQMAQLDGMKLPVENQEAATTFRNSIFDVMAQEMSWDKLKEDYVDIYANTFSLDELRGIIAFYKSPTGEAFLKKTPFLMEQSMQVAQKRMASVAPRIQELLKKLIEETRAKPKPQ